MWKRFPECISFDNTYNTNRFKLPLFQATGQTCLGTVFNAAFGLIDNERREGFQFLAEGIKQLVEKHSIRQPTVIITDFDDAMKAALNDQFPDAQQQLCIHHINSNVILRAKQKWLKLPVSSSSSDSSTNEEDPASQSQAMLSAADKSLVNSTSTDDIPHTYQGVLIMWKSVLFAETEETHEKAWKALCKEFMDQRPILRYLFGTYMPVRLQWARCYIRWFQNFGIRVTSGTEASNNNVKSYLLNGMSHLYRLVEAMQDMLKDQERDFRDACANDEVLTDRAYLGSSSEYLGELRTVVSSKGLMLIHRQYLIARKAMPTGKTPYPEPLGPCDNNCSVSIELGIPCSHKVHARIMSNAPFTKWDVHPRWRLRPSSSRNPYQRILDPKIATSLRGRPRNTAQTIPARMAIDASNHFADFQPSQPSGRKRGRPKGSRNKSTLTRIESLASQASPGFSSQVTATSQPAISQANVATQPLLRSQSRVLGAGNTTGVRASGRRTQPSIRRTKSQWEMLEQIDGEDVFDSIVVRE
ncbi:uncharacterized protein VDAG_02395 [Verticillium dahliae VdLs.17]|uniref:MULE transposase domain-containing protein n=2 Tax=Verticillium dahliae TaxID=27337 RepID=G2WXR3_VERDV|nr:uncharacterized protein VDAG_02395 [Verticillium dahliae VdLs.17]AER39697.1 transposase [Verticillium dahliae]EGY20871.1 hypothetical protein VDAG_02395 [Verticillium dahliae VdLs.17]